MGHLISVEIDSEVAKEILRQLDLDSGKGLAYLRPIEASELRAAIEEALASDDG